MNTNDKLVIVLNGTLNVLLAVMYIRCSRKALRFYHKMRRLQYWLDMEHGQAVAKIDLFEKVPEPLGAGHVEFRRKVHEQDKCAMCTLLSETEKEKW